MSNGSLQPHRASQSLPPTLDHTELLDQGNSEEWRYSFPEIIGRSAAMAKMLQVVHKIARTDSSVLIYGESGTGKELIASAIHRLSPRSSKRFIALNCSAIPENLIETELFGHEKGAFTGATSRRPGHFEVANGGTILLDEIGDMPFRLQAKILRILQEKQYTPIGSSQLINTDVRIIAATNVDLKQAVANKNFRMDLFYRLNVLPIHLPPLRERSGDIEPLIEHFTEVANAKHSVSKPCYFKSEVMTFLANYSWPGNVRELQNLIERLVVISGGGPISLSDLPKEYFQTARELAPPVQTIQDVVHEPPTLFSNEQPGLRENTVYPEKFGKLPEEGIDLTSLIEDLENNYIMQALKVTNNNKNQAAKLLGLNRTTLVERIKKRRLAPLNSPSKEL